MLNHVRTHSVTLRSSRATQYLFNIKRKKTESSHGSISNTKAKRSLYEGLEIYQVKGVNGNVTSISSSQIEIEKPDGSGSHGRFNVTERVDQCVFITGK